MDGRLKLVLSPKHYHNHGDAGGGRVRQEIHGQPTVIRARGVQRGHFSRDPILENR